MSTYKIICGDCLEVMRAMPDKSVDLVLTDPPYGVGVKYDIYDDSFDNLEKMVNPFIKECLRVGKRTLITCGNGNQYIYPFPDWTLAWVIPAGNGRCKWGFLCWQPILAYGKDPFLENNKGARRDIIIQSETSIDYGHPCSKPIGMWMTLLQRGSINDTDIILDPFMGSGTTGVAALKLGRNFIGIEISPKYCAMAEKRIKDECGLLIT